MYASEDPLAGKHNLYRVGDLSVYQSETIEAISSLEGKIDEDKCTEMWEKALSSKWEKGLVWIHGDLAPGNLIVKNARLRGVIDFGMVGVGDPACDLVMAWTYFNDTSRSIFKGTLGLDEQTWDRA